MVTIYDNNGYLWASGIKAPKLIMDGRSETQKDNHFHQISLTLEPVKGWKTYGNISYTIGDTFNHRDNQQMYNHDVAGNPYLFSTYSAVTEDAGRTNYIVTNIYSEYSRTIGNHNFKVMAGFQSELAKSRYLYAYRQGIIIRDLPSLDITTGTDYKGVAVPPGVGGNYNQWATEGYFGRLNYDYKGRYLIEGNLRYDGTSRFVGNKQWNLFPSASVGWNVSREDFWKNIEPYVSYFKIRGSIGQLGNQNTSSLYPTYATMPVGIANSTWIVGGQRPNTASAPALISSSLTWERVKSIDGGLDLGLFKNRLTGSFDWYVRYTSNMVGPAPTLPVTLGIAVPKTNNTDLKTQGVDFSLGWTDRLKNGIGYSINLLLSDSRTRITRYPNPTNNLDTYIAGQMAGDIWGYTTIGIAKTQEEMDAHLASLTDGGQNAVGANWRAGDIMYKDLNDDGKISRGSNTLTDPGDLSVIGNTSPRYSYGMDLKADWKGFDIRTFIQGIGKRDFFMTKNTSYGNQYYFWGPVNTWAGTWFKQHLDYFRPADTQSPLGPNVDSYYPRPIMDDYSDKNRQIQTRYLLSAAYARLKNLQVGYTLPSSMTKKVGIEKLRVYFSGENLLTITKMPEMFDAETVDGGWGGNIYPLSKTLSFGASINF
jgi:TonB-linked SusC/RagA family outer membrane protein